ncbi:MAG: acetate kinase [Coriobacteriales bacterium]|jgi:acetate kinase|nr:acetate kinase [Coriobacteriales bacterium]
MKILVLNAGSSSLKYQLIDSDSEMVLAKGLCERVGSSNSFHKYEIAANENCNSYNEYKDDISLTSHHDAVAAVLAAITDAETGAIASLEQIDAIGHRVVHGGEFFSESVLIDEQVIKCIDECSSLAPLHNPAGLMGIYACNDLLAGKPQVAVFDTAFHHSMPQKAYIYPLPYELYESKRIRRYGFHGTSHRYIAQRAAKVLQRELSSLRLITCHLGNGCSITAVNKGVSVDTSMGFTPLEGLMMGTRSGSIDPAIVTYLIDEAKMTSAEVADLMNKKSGLLGVSGISNDLRDVRAAAEDGNERAILAYEIYANAVKKYIGAYTFAMGGVDAVIIAGGVGENCDRMRRMIFEGLEHLGLVVNQERNLARGGERKISADESAVQIFVIPTNEELMIARDTVAMVSS